MDAPTSPPIQLPLSIIDKIDIGRLNRELDALNNFLEAAATRQPETKPKLPKTSRLLDEILGQNKLDALLVADRKRLKNFLEDTKANAPVIHVSFSADPTPLFSQKLVAWLREKIDPLILLQVGLQPTIGAGCIVRTTNKQFDFSLRRRLVAERGILIKKLREVSARSEPAPVLTQPPARAPEPPPAVAPPPPAANASAQPVVPLAPTEPGHE